MRENEPSDSNPRAWLERLLGGRKGAAPGGDDSNGILAAVCTVVIAGFAFVFAIQQLSNFDLWWHLRTGEWILEHHSIPTADPFSFSVPGAAWTPHYWLSDVILALTHRAGGPTALIFLKACIIGLGFAAMHRVMVSQRCNPLLAMALLGLVVVIARFRFMVRPHVVLFLFSPLCLYLLASWGEGSRKKAIALVLLMFAWVNLHASFILCIVFTGCLLTEQVGRWLWDRRQGSPAGIAPPVVLGIAFAGVLAMVFATPLGADLFRWVLHDFTAKSVTRSFEIEEHRALHWGEHRLYWSLLVATAASFLISGRRSHIWLALVALATTYLAFSSVRFVGLSSFVLAATLGLNLQVGLDRLGTRGLRLSRRWQVAVLAPLLSVGGYFAFTQTFTESGAYRFGLGTLENRYPRAGVEFMGGLGVVGNIFNSWELGGYLLWHLPQSKIAMDGRSLQPHLEIIEKTGRMTPDEFAEWVQRFDVGAAFLSPGDEPYASFFANSEVFKGVFFDDRSVIYLREDHFDKAVAEGKVQAYRLIRPDSLDIGYLSVLARGDQAAEAERELRTAARATPNSFNVQFMLGFFLEEQGRGDALDAYEAAIAANARLAYTHYGMGLRAGKLALKNKQWQRAIAILKDSLQYGDNVERQYLLATAYYLSGEQDLAAPLFDQVLEQQPTHVGALSNRGFLHIDGMRFDDAAALFARARQLAPADPNALYGHALSLQKAGKKREAATLWRAFLEKFPTSPWAAKARSFLGEAAEPRTEGDGPGR